jgi:hypothetical protein
MKELTDANGLGVIEASKLIDAASAAVRLFAITQLFYRQPVGDAAWTEMIRRIGREGVDAIAMLSGWLLGAANRPLEGKYRELAGLE